MMFWWLGFGAASVAYGLRGERLPGKFISITNATNDNGLSMAERAFWIASGMGEFTLGFVQLYARYKAS